MHDYTKANLDPETRGMLDFATKLTREPANMSEAHVKELRALELSDEQILSVVLITCTFNFMTRLADGLGVQVPEGRQEAHERWLTGPALQQDWLMKAKP
jgi:alkylhydroperoxidase family enzyme